MPDPSDAASDGAAAGVVARASARPVRLHLDYLDGVRGLAALYVVLHHARGFVTAEVPHWVYALLNLFVYGHWSVAVFIVLSGYCLALPVARAGLAPTNGGVLRFLGRRARRLLPPYYAAFAASLALVLWVPGLSSASLVGTIWEGSAVVTVGGVLSHLLLIHNWSPYWVYRINIPLWSVATEMQIYPFMPLLLLPLLRRFGAAVMVAAGFLVGFIPVLFEPVAAAYAAPWYLGLFSLGMVAAMASATAGEQRIGHLPWGILTALAWTAVLIFAVVGRKFFFSHMEIADCVVGSATALLLIWCTSLHQPTRLPSGGALALRFFNHPLSLALGRFSYSLYLTHMPVLALVFVALGAVGLQGTPRIFLLFVLGIPLALVVGFAFYLAVERHFLNAGSARNATRRAWEFNLTRDSSP